MSPYTRKIIKNIEARGLPVSLMILLVVASLSGIFFVLSPYDLTVSAATTDQFVYYKPLTLNHSQVPSTLSNFPVFIDITDTDLRDNCLSSGWDIAFFDDANNQLNHEVEYWDNSTGDLIAWVSVTSLKHDVDTVIYMYYGDSDIGAPAENVGGTWDSNYIAVYHMGGVKDSSGNLYNFTTDTSDSILGRTYKYSEFIRANTDNCIFPNLGIFSGAGSYTIEVWTYNHDATNTQGVIEPQSNYEVFFDWGVTDNKYRFGNNFVTSGYKTLTTSTTFSTNTWYYVVCSYSTVSGAKIYVDNVLKGSDATTGNIVAVTNNNYVGRKGSSVNHFDGYMDEIRIANTVRSTDWHITTFNTISNATEGGFFSFGSQQNTLIGEYEISGLDVNSRFPFNGEAGDIVWSTGNITMNIYTNVSLTSEECTDIFIDFADIDVDIVQENFSIAIINTSDGSWGDISDVLQVSAVDGNMTINATTWSTGVGAGWADGTNPFPIAGDNSTLAVRVRVNIPIGKAVGTYTIDSWYVLWKVTS